MSRWKYLNSNAIEYCIYMQYLINVVDLYRRKFCGGYNTLVLIIAISSKSLFMVGEFNRNLCLKFIN